MADTEPPHAQQNTETPKAGDDVDLTWARGRRVRLAAGATAALLAAITATVAATETTTKDVGGDQSRSSPATHDTATPDSPAIALPELSSRPPGNHASGNPTGTPNHRTPQNPASPSQHRQSPAVTSDPGSLLKRRDPVPADALHQVEVFGGGGACGDLPPSVPIITTSDEGPVELPGIRRFCFRHFDPATSLDITITDPRGRTTSRTMPPSKPALTLGWYYAWLPGHSVGQYRISAKQTGRSAALTIDVARVRHPRVWHPYGFEHDIPAGAKIHLYLGGFPEKQIATLDLYGPARETNGTRTAAYRTSFTALTDTNGEAHIIVNTEKDDPPGCYAVTSRLRPPPNPRPPRYDPICIG